MAISLNTLNQNYDILRASHQNPDHEYFNMSTVNQYTDANTLPKFLRFSQTKQFNIVGKTSDYYLSIIRWNLQSNLPVLIPDIQIKPSPEKYTGLTDYQIALMYASEQNTTIPDTYGIYGVNGSNYNGIFEDGIYGNQNTYNLVVPKSYKAVDYDNYNNGLSTNGSNNGSVYVISADGLHLYVYDKVSSQQIFEAQADAGYIFEYVTTNKTTGDFILGKTLNNVIEYIKFTRTGANTWSSNPSSIFTSSTPSNLVADITIIGNNLYELSLKSGDVDDIIGVDYTSELPYFVKTGIQATGGFLASPLIIYKGVAYCVGNNEYLFGVDFVPPYPAQPFTPINTTTRLSSNIFGDESNYMYALGYGGSTSQNYPYLKFDYRPPQSENVTNNFSNPFGYVNLPTSGGNAQSILSIDLQESTHKLIAVGATNNLYITQNPVANTEMLFFNTNLYGLSQQMRIWGLNNWDNTGVQENYKIVDQNPFQNLISSASINKLLVYSDPSNSIITKFYVSSYNPNTQLQVYDATTNALLTNNTNFDASGINALSLLPIAKNFAYVDNNSNLKINKLSDLTNVKTCPLPSPINPEDINIICELDANTLCFDAVGDQSVQYVYIYSYTTNNIVYQFTVLDIARIWDLCVVQTSGQLTTLFVLGDSDGFSNRIVKVEFNNNYTSQPTSTNIYTSPNTIAQISTDSNNNIIFVEGQYNQTTSNFTNYQVKTLFADNNYNISNIAIATLPTQSFEGNQYFPDKNNLTISTSTTQTYFWNQITSNIQLLSVTLGANDLDIYGVNAQQENYAIYKGTLNNNSVNFGVFNGARQYSYVSNLVDPPTEVYNISEWKGFGAPSTVQQLDVTTNVNVTTSQASLNNDGTDVYASYAFDNNTSKLNKIDPSTLTSLLNTTLTQQLLNGVIGLDEDNNILVSVINNNNNSLLGFNPSNLNINFTEDDPLIEYNTSSAVFYPYVKTSSTTTYNLASDGAFNLIYIPETVDTNLENTMYYPKTKNELYANPYFYMRYVDTFCRMINVGIEQAFKSIQGATWAHLPYFQWNSIDGKIVYNQPLSNPVVPNVPSTAKWYVTVNQPLFALLNTFRFKHFLQGAGNSSIYPESLACRYLLDTNILSDATTQSTGEFQSYVQQISSVQTWSPIISFVFTSTILPIENQITGQPQNLNTIDPSLGDSIIAQSNQQKILTDFITPLVSGVEQTNQIIYYIPQGEYRLVDLIGNSSLQQLSLEVYWKDKFSVLHPLTLDAGASSDLLCMLRRKTYNY